MVSKFEATVGIAPTHKSFADSCLTTWLRGRLRRNLGLTRLSRKPVNPQELPAQAARVCPISSLKSAFEPHRTLSTPRLNPRFCLELGQTRKSYYKLNAALSPIFIPRSLTNPAFASKTKLASCLGATMIFLESAEVAAIFS